MASHAVRRLIELRALADDPTRLEATLELQCGCRVTRTIAEDRVVERPGGERFVVGKIPCPERHPVRASQRG